MNDELIEKYENERQQKILEINADYDAKINHIKKKKLTIMDEEVDSDKVEFSEKVIEPTIEDGEDTI